MCAILLVEDHDDTRVVFAKLLRSWGHEVVTAESMLSALLGLDRSTVEVMISDIGLPDASGWDLMRHVRVTKPHIYAIAITAYCGAVDEQRSRGAGFDLHLRKPLDLTRLYNVVRDPGLIC